MRVRGLGIMVALSAALAVPVRAQQLPATPFLPAQHWANQVVRRLQTLVPADPHDVGSSTLTHAEVVRRLRFVRENAPDSAIGRLAGVYLDRFLEEFSLSESPVQLYERNVGAQYVSLTGRAAPGTGYIRDEDWTGARPLADVSRPTGVLHASATLSFVAAHLSVAGNREVAVWDETQGIMRLGPLEFWGGRRAPKFGPASGLVLSGNAYINGGGFELARAVRLPWILRYAGPFHFEAFASRLKENGRRSRPWFWGARGSLQPLPYLTLGVNRSAMFGGDGHPADFIDILQMVAGGYGGQSGDFENQVVSVDARLAIAAPQPIEFYVEWAADDGSGMWKKAPAITVGSMIPTFRALPSAFAGIEFTTVFRKPECCNTYWYRNVFFRGGWTKDDVPLGHPLGGHGTEWALSLGVDPADARVRLRARLLTRDREEENLFAPERAGRSFGVEGGFAWRVRRGELELGGALEDGKGWRSSTFRVGVRALF
jgi:hypothetical protein